MRYVGGKSRIASWVQVNLETFASRNSCYLEPFVGGGSILARMAPLFGTVEAGDAHEDLILMWQAAQSGWVPPERVTREEYEALRCAEPSALRGFVGFGASFSGKWFGGYVDQAWDNYHQRMTKPYAQAASRAVVKDAAKFSRVTFKHCDYTEWQPRAGTLVYCDPPYAVGTGYNGIREFDSALFWRTAQAWAERGADVVVSEAGAPKGWIVLAERERAHMLRATKGVAQNKRRETLFVLQSTSNRMEIAA